MTEQSADDDLREWFWRCSLNLQNAAIKSVPQIAHPCDADHFADDAMRRVDALIAQRVSAETERCAQIALQYRDEVDAGEHAGLGDPERALGQGYAANLIGKRIRAPAEHPAPAAVVDYTERARAIIGIWWPCIDEEARQPIAEAVYRALSAVASEHQAAPYGYLSRLFRQVAPQCEPLPDLMGLCTQIDSAFVYVREQAADAERAALLARLQEPDVREAVKAAMRERDFARDGEYLPDDCYEAFADAALTKIAEMLK